MPSVLRALAVALCVPLIALGGQESKTGPGNPSQVGVFCHVKVLSDKMPDICNLETWKKAYI